MMRVKKNDTVMVITGKYKGTTGTVLEIQPEKQLVKVQGVAIVTKHVKARRQGEVSAIRKQEGYIHLSNVMVVADDNKPSRVNYQTLEDGKKVRISNRTKNPL